MADQVVAKVNINSTVCPVFEAQLVDGFRITPIRFGAVDQVMAQLVDGAGAGTINLRMPLHAAQSLLGLVVTKVTAFDLWMYDIQDGLKQANGYKLSLDTNAAAIAKVTAIRGAHRTVAVADVTINAVPTDTSVCPWDAMASDAVPATTDNMDRLHVVASASLNGASYAGVAGVDMAISYDMEAPGSDSGLWSGNLLCQHAGTEIAIQFLQSQNTRGLFTNSKPIAVSGATNVVFYTIVDGLVSASNALTFSVSNGTLLPVNVGGAENAFAQQGVVIAPLTSTDTASGITISS